MIELIGVVAVIAILAAVLIPTVIKRIDRAAWERETQDLNTLAQGLVQSIKITRHIPPTNGIAGAIANYRNLAPNQVITNPRGFSRVILVDPSVSIGSYNPSSSSDYTNSNTGPTTRPTNARVLFLSTLASPALTSVSSGDFNQIWEAPESTVPACLTNGNRNVDDLKIQRLNLGGLFHKLHLQNIDISDGWYTLDANAPTNVPPLGSSRSIYVLDGTAVNLYMTNTSMLQLREIMIEDQSFVYHHGRWVRDLTTPQLDVSLGEFGSLVDQFLNAGWRPNAANGARPQAVIESFYTYMVDYIIWSRGDPSHGITNWQGGGQVSYPSYPYFKVLSDAQAQVNNVTGNLIKK